MKFVKKMVAEGKCLDSQIYSLRAKRSEMGFDWQMD
jgi:hypothetical protein